MHHGGARAGGLFASRAALDATFVVISITAVPQASLLLAINNEARALRHVVGTNIATVAAVDGLGGWSQLLPALVACMESDSVAAMEGALDALYKVHTRLAHAMDTKPALQVCAAAVPRTPALAPCARTLSILFESLKRKAYFG